MTRAVAWDCLPCDKQNTTGHARMKLGPHTHLNLRPSLARDVCNKLQCLVYLGHATGLLRQTRWPSEQCSRRPHFQHMYQVVRKPMHIALRTALCSSHLLTSGLVGALQAPE